jgi:hypothetical protein
MKKNRIYIFLLLLLTGVLTLFILKNKTTTLKKELRDFAIEDTASITKIFMVDKEKNKILLERQPDNSWTVNEKFKARQDLVNLLLETFFGMEVKYPVPHSSFNTEIKRLSNQSTKVEVYAGERLLKTYYVGGPTQSHTGTFMLLKGSSVPMVVELPGFLGYLTPRFRTMELAWRTNSIFNYAYPQIKSVQVEYPETPEKSFKIENENNHYKLIRLQDRQEITNFDTLAIKEFIARFKNINYDHIMTSLPKPLIDSMNHAKPLMVYTVVDVKGRIRTIRNYKKLQDKDTPKASLPNMPKYDLDNMYGYIPQDSIWVMVQYYVFDPLTKTISDFIPQEKIADKK